MHTRLIGWKKFYLSKLNYVAFQLTFYLYSPLPVGVAKRLEKIQRDIIWSGLWSFCFLIMLYKGNGCSAMEKKMLVEEGGRFEVQHHLGGWCSDEARGPYNVDLWKNIRIKLYLFSSFIRYDVGNGSKIFVGVTFGMVRQLLRRDIQAFF